jgi:uncharacterized protein with NRDE domain
MCLLGLWVGRAPDAPLIAARNRDEFFARPAAAPAEIEPGIVAGKDLRAGARGSSRCSTSRSAPVPTRRR